MNCRIALAVSFALGSSIISLPLMADTAKHKSGKSVYIVELDESPVATYEGGLQGFTATSSEKKRNKLNTRSDAVVQYRRHLKNRQSTVLSAIADGTDIPKALAQYQLAFNGFAAKLTPAQAKTLSQTEGVKKVRRDTLHKLNAYVGPATIGAPQMWDGTETSSGSDVLGEGMVVAVLDTGINTDHPSFAATGDDGYAHTNPLGSGNYLGDCAGSYPALCNDKLIGVYSYPAIVNAYSDTDIFPSGLPENGEDYNGHGSHVAATAAGNILYNVAEVIPDYDQTASDGVETGYIFEEVSGVAPHANIISYQVCYPGEDDDTYTGCLESVMLDAVEDIIDSGIVDAVNMSISGGDFPWDGPLNRAWLNAHNAGIFVAQSAGNDGPDDATTDKHAPWMTAVAATSHGISVSYEKSITNFSGGSYTPAAMQGFSNTGSITADIVYAGDFPNGNDPSGDPGQCLEPYPAGTFSGQIVVCDRGDIARIQKAKNVAEGGAAGYVLANVQGGDSFLANDAYVVPGIHIDADAGDALKQWLASGSGHRVTITEATAEVVTDETTADKLADFSSRGPNSSISTLSPVISAPGVEIYAAWADEHYGHEESGPAPADYAYSSGTSMASPHVAGAALLLKQDHPSWTPDNIRSAMMMTANTGVALSGTDVAANWFEMGAGRLQVDAATQTGLIMQETAANYSAANPQEGGEPRSLNVPAVVDENCVTSCSWTRTVTATRSGSWQVTATAVTSGLSTTVSPSSFSLASGQSQTLTFTMDTLGTTNYAWAYGSVNLTSSTSPDLHIPVAVYASNGSIPQFVDLTAHRNEDSRLLKDVTTAEIESFNFESYGLTQVTTVVETVSEDPTPDELFDSASGTVITEINVEEGALRLYAEIYDATASDLDLFLVYDADGDGNPSDDEIREESSSLEADEVVDRLNPEAGTWFIVVQNWEGSSASSDSYMMDYVLVDADDEGNLTVSGPQTNAALSPFDLRILWDLGDSSEGDKFFGAFALGTSSSENSNVGVTHVVIEREENDVYMSAPDDGRVNRGGQQTFNVNIISNTTGEDRDYTVGVTLPDKVSLVAGSVSDNGSVTGNRVYWEVTQPDSESTGADAQTSAAATLSFAVTVEDSASTGPLSLEASSVVTNIPGAGSENAAVFSDVQVEGAPVVTIAGGSTATAVVSSGNSLSVTAEADEPNGDAVTWSWEQLSGPALTLNGTNTATVTISAPSVQSDTTAVLQVTATDPSGNQSVASVTVTISPNQPPVLSVTSPASVSAGSTITIRATATDPENDTLSFTIDGVAGSVYSTQAPDSAAGSSVSYTVTVSDGINTVSVAVSVAVTERQSSGGGGSTGILALLLVPVIVFRRWRRM